MIFPPRCLGCGAVLGENVISHCGPCSRLLMRALSEEEPDDPCLDVDGGDSDPDGDFLR